MAAADFGVRYRSDSDLRQIIQKKKGRNWREAKKELDCRQRRIKNFSRNGKSMVIRQSA